MLPALNSDYIAKINELPFLTKKEEYTLAKRFIEYQDLNAAEKLVLSHLRLVVKIASTYKTYGIPVMDLIQEGTVGLMQAVKHFNPDLGARLGTYATYHIKYTIQDYIMHTCSLVKIGTTAAQKKLFYNLRKLRSKLNIHDNMQLHPEDITYIAKELDVDEDEVISMDSRLMQTDKSLNDLVLDAEEPHELQDSIKSNDIMHDIVLAESENSKRQKRLLKEALLLLNDREKEILKLRYFNETSLTLEEVSYQYNISRERVRQIEARSIEKIKEYVTR